MKRPAPIARDELLEAVAPLLELLGVKAEDVTTLHVGPRAVTVRTVARGRTGRVVDGITTATTHRVVREPVED